jgi:hypothetical protein
VGVIKTGEGKIGHWGKKNQRLYESADFHLYTPTRNKEKKQKTRRFLVVQQVEKRIRIKRGGGRGFFFFGSWAIAVSTPFVYVPGRVKTGERVYLSEIYNRFLCNWVILRFARIRSILFSFQFCSSEPPSPQSPFKEPNPLATHPEQNAVSIYSYRRVFFRNIFPESRV